MVLSLLSVDSSFSLMICLFRLFNFFIYVILQDNIPIHLAHEALHQGCGWTFILALFSILLRVRFISYRFLTVSYIFGKILFLFSFLYMIIRNVNLILLLINFLWLTVKFLNINQRSSIFIFILDLLFRQYVSF